MVKVIITGRLYKDIAKKFSKIEANKIIDLLETLEENPSKGKEICFVGKIVIKEIKYQKFRFYFIINGYKLKFLKAQEIKDLIIKFVRMSRTVVLDHDQKSKISDMSEKKNQQKTIDEIKTVLRSLGEEGF
ncbi:TPA: hypothetical protein HA371_03265 [Candidatus Woesearchaeota archaeon]|nr:hypothetical protein [Candidatus Woesearchaeota archaeon]